MTQIGIYMYVREKEVLLRMEIKAFCTSLTSLCAVLINVMTENFEVLRTCSGSVAMATTYVVMFGLIVYGYPQCGKHM